MKIALKIVLWLVGIAVIVIAGLLSYVKFMLPNAPEPPDIKVEITDERVERGRYLANTVMACASCHSPRDWAKFSAPPVEDSLYAGGHPFDREKGFPGNYYPSNLTPAGIGDWTDGELFRALTHGVTKEGKAMFATMPYDNYGKLSREDLYAVIAYLRTLEPIEKDWPDSESDFPMNFIINLMPKEPELQEIPPKSDKIAYGKYVATAASCNHCHTPLDGGRPVKEMEYAGGMEFEMPTGGTARSANITPDKKTGIGNWSEEMFVQRFKNYKDSIYKQQKVQHGHFNSEMPWTAYADMTDEDLRAIYAYLMSLEPKEHQVVTFTPEK